MIEEVLLCPDAVPSFLNIFDFSIAPPLLFYAYIPILLFSVLFSFFVFRKDRSLFGKLLFFLACLFALWILDVLILWTAAPVSAVMFWWQILPIFEVLIFITGIGLILSLGNRTILETTKGWLLLPLLVVLVTLPTKLNLSSFDLDYCEAAIGPLWYFLYGFEVISVLTILGITLYRLTQRDSDTNKWENFISLGIFFFLGIFSATNIVGDFTGLYTINLVGPIGMVIFFAFLTYAIFYGKIFGIKLLGVQVLVAIIWILVGSLVFLNDLEIIHRIIFATVVLLIPFGILLIKTVKREVALREQLQVMNKQQVETMRFITHEVKGYLTDSSGAFDALLTNTFGEINNDTRAMVTEALAKDQKAISEIKEFLRISDFKTGKVAYQMKPFDFKKALEDALPGLEENAKKKGLELKSQIADGTFRVLGDTDQLTNHVIGNLINNATNYTPQGSITVSLSRSGNRIVFAVKDSGIGLTDEDKKVLFTEGGRGAESRNVNPHSTGYGLFIAKKIIEAHSGRIWAESDGRGKGSVFFVELPAIS